MSFFKKLFGGKPKNDYGPMPTRGMNFQFAVTPENGEKLANQFRNAVKSNENIELGYSLDTLDYVDQFLQKFRNEGLTVNDFAETIFLSGCYVGQVMVQNNGGQWIKQEDANLPEGVKMMPIVVQLPSGTIADPIAKAFKRFYHGEVDSVRYFYEVFTEEEG